jgi:hypothetical protein
MVFDQVDQIQIKKELRGILQRYGWTGMLRSMLRGIAMYLQRRDYREFVAETRRRGITPGNPSECLGYGLMIAKKPD